jgi:hypothetical protein
VDAHNKEVQTDGSPAGGGKSEGGPPSANACKNSRKGIPRDEAEIRVREWLESHAKADPAAVTRDRISIGARVSAGMVSKTSAWKAFRDRRDAEAKPQAREVPLSDAILEASDWKAHERRRKNDSGTALRATIPDDCESPDELAALIEEQASEGLEQKRRHERRRGPS